MSAVAATAVVSSGPPVLTQLGSGMSFVPAGLPTGTAASFSDVLARGVNQIASKLDTADDMVRRLALGEDLPIHQVSYALEEARLSVEMAMQVRSRLLDGYREMMNLQL